MVLPAPARWVVYGVSKGTVQQSRDVLGAHTNEATDGDEDVFAAVPLIESQEAHSRSTGLGFQRQGIVSLAA